MIVREYEPRDSERVYDILCSSLDETYRQETFSYFHMQWPKGQLVICDLSGMPMGFISSLRADLAHARIMMFAVDPGHRSMGLGSRLIMRFKQATMMSGINRISLEVRPSNTRAMSFYKRHGFAPTEVLRNYYNDGGDAVRMDLFLN